MASDPFGDSHLVAIGTFDYYPNTGRSGITMRAAVHVGYEFRHLVPETTCGQRLPGVKMFIWFAAAPRSINLHITVEDLVEKTRQGLLAVSKRGPFNGLHYSEGARRHVLSCTKNRH